MENEKIVRNSVIILLVIVVVAVIVAIPLWKADMTPKGVQTSEAAAGPEKVATPENTIMDSRTGEVVFVPESDPEAANAGSNSNDMIMDSRTGEEAPVPTSDPEG